MNLFLALTLAFAPGIFWLMFFLKEDVHPEPRKMIVKTFLVGALSSLFALFIELLFKDWLKTFVIKVPQIADINLSGFLFFAAVEEIVKFCFVWKTVSSSPYFDEPIDAMIYMITGALGFATAENFFFVFSSGNDVFALILLRFIGATLLHALSSAFLGYMWALGMKYKKISAFILAGLVLATLIHVVFNILVFKFNSVLLYPVVFLGIVGFVILYDFEKLRKEEIN
jgi:RsiW-degrading membrane proteinase PrsW (M82 family)